MENVGIFKAPSEGNAYIAIHGENSYLTELNTALRFYNNHGFITCDESCTSITIHSSTSNNKGSYLQLKSINTTNYPGELRLVTCKQDGSNILFRVCPDGNLLWDAKPIDTIISNNNNYIKYKNGLLLQWGRNYIPANESTKTISFYLPYKENDDNTYDVFITSNCTNIVSYIFHVNYKSASDFTVISHLSDGTLLGNKYFKWLAIGYWK